MIRSFAVVAFAGLLAVGGCQSLKSARDGIVRAPPRCESETVPIYFDAGAAAVNSESRRVIAEAASRARGCTVKAVTVMGLADAAGDPAANLDLSRRRAESVGAAIAAAGLPSAQFGMAAAGETGAVTADGRAAPLRRRAEITLVLEAPK